MPFIGRSTEPWRAGHAKVARGAAGLRVLLAHGVGKMAPTGGPHLSAAAGEGGLKRVGPEQGDGPAVAFGPRGEKEKGGVGGPAGLKTG